MRLDPETVITQVRPPGSREAVLAELVGMEAALAELSTQVGRHDMRAGIQVDGAWRAIGYARDIIEGK